MKIDHITSFEELINFKDEWNDCLSFSSQDSVFLTHDWFVSWWMCFGKRYDLRILLFRDSSGKLNGIAPLIQQGRNLGFIASREVTDYCDLIIRQGMESETIRSFLLEVKKYSGQLDSLRLINLREDSPSLPLLLRSAEDLNLSAEIRIAEVSLRLDLPESYEAFISSLSRKNRHELRRKVKKMESFPGMEIERVRDSEKILILLETFIALHKKSSHSKAGFWEREGMAQFFREIALRFSRNGWLEFNVLSINEETAALLISFVYKNEFLHYNIAYDTRYAALSPGICLFNRTIDSAIEEGRHTVDFLRGREKYKYNFGAKECKIKDFILQLREN